MTKAEMAVRQAMLESGFILPDNANSTDKAGTPRFPRNTGSHKKVLAAHSRATAADDGLDLSDILPPRAKQPPQPIAAPALNPASSPVPSDSPKPGPAPQRPRVLSIAGTDPTGGAGVLSDIKTILACGGYGMGVVTSVVAQNTREVTGVWPQSGESIATQLRAVSDDVSIDAVKIGMLGSREAIEAVRVWLSDTDFRALGGLWRRASQYRVTAVQFPAPAHGPAVSADEGGADDGGAGSDRAPVGYHGMATAFSSAVRPWTVLDPVMVSTSGARLLDPDAQDALMELLQSGLIDVVTPNIPEMAALLGEEPARTWEDATRQGMALAQRLGGMTRVYVKSGHLDGTASRADAFIDAPAMRAACNHPIVTRLPGILIDTRNTHGTGCALSSALATLRPQCADWVEAAQRAKAWIRGSIRQADELNVGLGHGPINHAWNLRDNRPISEIPLQNTAVGTPMLDAARLTSSSTLEQAMESSWTAAVA